MGPGQINKNPEGLLSVRNSFFISYGFILLLASIYGTGFFGLLAGIAVNGMELPFSLSLTAILFLLSTRSALPAPLQIKILGIILVLLLISLLISYSLLDTSWDGQWYHQVAIDRINQGWNPLHEPFYPLTKYDSSNYVWIQHYPKYSWISASVIGKCTGFIETGKSINLLLAFALFFNSFPFFLGILQKKGWSLALSILLTLNPVLVTQLFSDYVDGLLAAFLMLMLLQLVSLEIGTNGGRNFRWAILGCCLVMISNIKFSGLGLSGLMILLFSPYWLIRRYSFRKLLKTGGGIALLFCFSFFFFGYNPYWTNFTSKKTFFYPFENQKTYDAIITRTTPAVMKDRNNLERLVISLFSECNNDIKTSRPPWKSPFRVSSEEIKLFATQDVRFSGFGPLFQLALWISFVLLAWTLLFYRNQPYYYLKLILLVSITGMTLLFRENWWARFSPQFFMFPFIAIIAGFTCGQLAPGRLIGILSKALILVLLANLLLVGGANLTATIEKTRLIRQEMSELKKAPGPVQINFNGSYFQAIRRRLTEAGVKYVETDSLSGNVRELRTLYRLEGFGPKYVVP